MNNELNYIINGKYDNIPMKDILAGIFINLDTDSIIKYFVQQTTNKDSVSLKELERNMEVEE